MALFRDRTDAGTSLAAALRGYCRPHPVVLALPRGGIPVAEPLARALGAEFDVIVVRKLGAPHQPEFAMGAVGEGGVAVVDPMLQSALGVTDEQLSAARTAADSEVVRRVAAYRRGRRAVDLANRNVVIVDDGLATGATARAAVDVVRARGAAHITVAVPVGSAQAVAALRKVADEVVCLNTPMNFAAVGQFFDDFTQVTDDAVTQALDRNPLPPSGDRRATFDAEVLIPCNGIELPGHLTIPSRPQGVVLFAHGLGSDRHSPRNLAVARALQSAGIGTLMFDLSSPYEAQFGAPQFDVDQLAQRLIAATDWVNTHGLSRGRPLGYFGSSTGAAVAVAAAAEKPQGIVAIVSRGGRVDLAREWLGDVVAPTLLIVGANDPEVLAINRRAQMALHCPSLLNVVPGAGHLFEEPGALAHTARLAQSWFTQHMAARPDTLRECAEEGVLPLTVAS